MELEFETQNAFTEYLARALNGQLTPEELRKAGDLIAADFTEKRLPPLRAGSVGLRVPVLRWVIKDDDVKLLESIFDGLKAGAAAGLIVGEPTTATLTVGVVGVAAAVVKLGRQFLRKGQKLTELEYQVVSALHASGKGLTESELVTWLGIMTHQKQDEVKIAETLSHLQAIALADGTVTALVSKDANGVLRAAGV